MAGIDALCNRAGVLVIVDILSFSTAVDVAVSRGAIVYPFASGDPLAAQAAADRLDAHLACLRRTAGGRFSLSPGSLTGIPAGTKLLLPSPNGSRLSLRCGAVPTITGCLRNAAVVAEAARALAGDGSIVIIPAGERWPDGSLRPAIEDLLGAGAILDRLDLPCSPEAQVARDAFRAAGPEVARLIRSSMSGQDLAERGFPLDVELALEQDISRSVPILREGGYRAA